MTLKSSRKPVLAGLLCLLLLGFAGASYGAVRYDVIPSPTEVINTGRSEVLGSIHMIVKGVGNVTGSSLGGAAQIGIIYNNPALQIDNTTATGIKLFFTTGFATAFTKTATSGNVGIVKVENIDLNGKWVGFITINLAPGAVVSESDYIRLEGVRGRIDASGTGLTPGTNFFAQLQSINDPAANQFSSDTVRVATSFDGMNIAVSPMNLLLCFQPYGLTPGAAYSNYIKITEGFARAFVDADSLNNGLDLTDRVDSGGQTLVPLFVDHGTSTGTPPSAASASFLGAPTNSTQFYVVLDSIPDSVASVTWQGSVAETNGPTGATLDLVSTTPITGGIATAIYEFNAINQTGASDLIIETFTLQPILNLAAGKTSTGTVNAGVSLAPAVSALAALVQPGGSAINSRPRFLSMIESDAVALGNPPDDPTKPYGTVIRCNCFLLFTYVTSDTAFDTGIALANTTGDTEVFGKTAEAPDQIGKITFFFYDKAKGYVGSYTNSSDILAGQSFVNVLSAMLPGVTPTPLTSFSGYVIAQAQFQFCHALAFIADTKFGSIAHGYIANVIPDPAIKTGKRTASAAGDVGNYYWNGSTVVLSTPLPAGEGLNN
jgi:hypothetical protein